jgi:GT2 family glycosyltransferase
METVDIIVPVYRGVDEVLRCLSSVVLSKQRTPFELVVINDASPEPEMAHFLREFAGEHRNVTLLENEFNLGFVATVNRGMALHSERDVVLLNSDTEVANDWLDRLKHPAQGKQVATVTPFSNNATICSFPQTCKSNALPSMYSLEQIDQAFAFANEGSAIDIPTGVGFCFYITRASLNALGYFDEQSFGRGYGEENDYCMRARLAGWRNLLCCDTFVFHEGGVSFSDEQDERVSNAQKILNFKYPQYHGDVYKHIETDPAWSFRVSAQLELLRAESRPKVLFLTHHLGGGTLKHIKELAQLLRDKLSILLLRPCGQAQVELAIIDDDVDWETLVFKLPDNYSDLVDVLEYLRICRMHFHHTVGLETSVWGLPNSLGVPYDITLHDYHFIGGNPSLTGDDGRYDEDPEVENSRYKRPVTLDVWQDNQRDFLSGSSRVFAPSKAAAAIYRRHYPELKITPVFHPDWYQDMPYRAVCNPSISKDKALRILVIGAISLEKGAELLEAVADKAHQRGRPFEFHLLGYACRPLSDSVQVYGAFEESHVDRLIAEIDPHVIWFPALWPETYSYTLSEALRSSRPILAPNIGAFPERLTNRPNTWVMPWDLDVDDWLEVLDSVRETLLTQSDHPAIPWIDQPQMDGDGCYYLSSYMSPIINGNQSLRDSSVTINHVKAVLERCTGDRQAQQEAGKRERVLKRLMTLRDSRYGRLLVRFIPLTWQRAIKRRLSSRPLHEIN